MIAGRRGPPCGIQQILTKIGFNIIVGIDEADILPGCRADPGVPCGCRAAVLPRQNPDPAVLCRERAAKSSCSIRRSVVHEQNFNVFHRLTADGIDRACQEPLRVIRRYDDGNIRLPTLLLSCLFQ